jgi:hypothetical protein
MADEPDPRQRLAEHGYVPALWMPGPEQHFLTPDGLRVVNLAEALAEIDAAEQEHAA